MTRSCENSLRSIPIEQKSLSKMGISGLLPLVKDAMQQNSHIHNYRGQRVAVDGYAWLHKAVFVCATELAKGQSSPKWIAFLLTMIDVLLDHGVSVTMVFDGAELPAKRGTESDRALKRQTAFNKAQAHEKAGKASEAYQYYCQSVDVSPHMAAEFIQVLRAKTPKVDVIVAPYEADAQLAYLCRNGLVDAVVSEDSDCIPYGCHNIIFKLGRDGSCQSLSLSTLYGTTIKGFNLRSFDNHMCQVMCVAAGCDYLPSVKNVGIKKAHELVSRHKTATKTLRVMRMNNQLLENGQDGESGWRWWHSSSSSRRALVGSCTVQRDGLDRCHFGCSYTASSR